MTIKIRIKGADETIKRLQQANKAIEEGAHIGLTKAGLHIQNEVKASIAGQRAEPTSVDTGRLLNSIDLIVKKEEVSVLTEVSYAKSIEYNPSIKGGPRRQFNNTVDREKQKVKEIIQNNIKTK